MFVVSPAQYRLKVEPIPGRVVAWRGDRIVADTTGAKLMHETRLPPTVYFPAEDVRGLGASPTDRRTFCPFKGTAEYRHVDLDGEVLENAAWRYPRSLPESKSVEGFVGFMPGVVDRVEAEQGMPATLDDGPVSSPLIDWLLREAWTAPDPAALTAALAGGFRDAGIAVTRLNVTIWSLHPQIAGTGYIWGANEDEVEVFEADHDVILSDGYLNSPIRLVSEGLGGVRQMLTEDAAQEFSFPIMDDLRAEGATDYVAMPLVFSDGRINVMTMATDHPGGFTTANLGLVFECSAVVARFYEVLVLRANARTLLGTFLGKRTGARVLGGEIRRGDGEEIEAAVLFCDLRGSSRIAERMERREYLALLNRFFEAAGGAVERQKGEVLKFIGDAVLAVFPADAACDAATACDAAIAAACAIQDEVGAIEDPTAHGRLRCTVGVSFGSVTYGNVGSPDRLDFTVIGAAANVAARLSDLGKDIDAPVLLGASVAAASGRELSPLGSHELHNVAEPVEVYGP